MNDPLADFQGKLFRKLPIEVNAIQYEGGEFGFGAAPRWLVDALNVTIHKAGDFETTKTLLIDTLEGRLSVVPGTWIVRGIKGELYPVKADIFPETFEPAD